MITFQDVDYLHATARVRAMETRALTRRELQKMVDCRSAEEAFKILTDTGICAGFELEDYEEGLAQSQAEAYALFARLSGDKGLVELFRYKYDGHNLKTLIKANKLTSETGHIVSTNGNIPLKQLSAQLEAGRFEGLHPLLANAALEAVETLAKTGDPQLVDVLLDKAVLEAIADRAKGYDSSFLADYVKAEIDIANIRAAVRIKRMGKDVFFLRRVLATGGKLDIGRLAEAFTKGWDELLALIAGSEYGKALAGLLEQVRSGSLTAFERACDNYQLNLLAPAQLKAFGVEPLIAYLLGKESQLRAARIVLASKLAGVPAQQISERLREVL